jgi:hypothetical protein
VCAFLVPASLHRLVAWRLQASALPSLSLALGESLSVGDVEVTLLGTLRLSEISLGTLFSAKAIEASVGLGTLMSGSVAADEIQVYSPRLVAHTRPDGSLSAAELVTRVRELKAKARARSAGEKPRARTTRTSLRRIVVQGGELVLSLGDRGEIRARDVELHPQEGGVRVVAGRASLQAQAGSLVASCTFARTGVDLELPSLRVSRAALDGGRIVLAQGTTAPLEIFDVVLAHGRKDGTTQILGRTASGPFKLRMGHDDQATQVELAATSLPLGPLGAWLPAWLDVARAAASGALTLRYDRASRSVTATFDADVRGVSSTHPLLSSTPLSADVKLQGQGSFDLRSQEGRAEVQVQTGHVNLRTEGELQLGEAAAPRAGRLRVELPPTQCSSVFAEIPAALRAPLDGLEVDGTLGLIVDLAFDRERPEEARLDFEVDLSCQVVREATVAQMAPLRGAYRHTLPSGAVRTLGREDPSFVPLATLPPHIAAAFVAGEDALFYQHHGFDAEQLRRSFAYNVAAGRTLRGGSTISQQLAKNLFLSRERTLSRKLLEAALTWQLEESLGKRRILEIYLNIIELGEGTFGLGPASRRWFGKEAKRLTVAEAAFLASLAPAPVSIERRLAKAHKMDVAAKERVATILRSMRRNRLLAPAQYQEARRQALTLRL